MKEIKLLFPVVLFLTQKTTIWENEKIYTKQFMVTGSNTFRVRVLLSWK